MNGLKRESYIGGAFDSVDQSTLRKPPAGVMSARLGGIDWVLSDASRLTDGIKSLSSEYRLGKPYPHLVVDNLFSEDLLNRVVLEIPPPGHSNWVRHDDEHIRQFNLRSALALGDAGSQLVAFLHSAKFLYFLSEVTGIWELLPDPYLQGGGYHLIPRGGKFDVHVDRNVAYSIGLVRRLSVLIYLNKGWKHEYGGQLELWSRDGSQREASIEPIFNRTTIFEITDENYHGVPSAVRCPKRRSRNCFAVYYHTAEGRGAEELKAHTSIYSPRSYGQAEPRFRQFLKDLVPPILLRAARKVRAQR
jgi:hypothetical protein